ncbi:MAG: filamentous hemagglutinin N-terminal domain-containing protein [Nitrospina sp.]|nr:filamentous hemagglutinin N-terminal domain-containing protein [Nitrospina sp.]
MSGIKYKKTNIKKNHRKILTVLIGFFILTLVFAHSSSALPTDPTVQAGNVQINQPNAQQLNVIQGSDKAIIDWRSFSIQANETVEFKLPSSNGLTLNRVTGNQASSILGQLKSSGRVVLINPNGVIFGDTARVDVHGLIATTTDISNWDFMNGSLNFNLPSNSSSGVVINKGNITVADGGLVALVAPGVANSGTINARLGKVSLVSGNTFTLDLYGDQLINLGINNAVVKKATGMYGEKLDAMVSNSGKIYADGGIVTLQVATAQNALDQIVNMDGIIQAKTFSTNKGGSIILDGGNKGTVNVSGQLDASGKWMGQKGGVVRVAGRNVELRDGALVDVSAHSGQGSAYIGGDAKGNAQNSYRTLINKGSRVNADRRTMGWGNGGKIVVKGGTNTNVYGALSAKGGSVDINPGKVTPPKTMKLPSPKKMNTPKNTMKVQAKSKKMTLKLVAVKPKPQSKRTTKSEPKQKTKTEPKPSAPEVGSFARNTNNIGGVELAQNFNTQPSSGRTFNGLGGVSTTSSDNSSPISSIRSETFTPPGQQDTQTGIESVDFGADNTQTFNGLGGVSTTSSDNSSPISSIRSETFTPPGQQDTQEQDNSEPDDSSPATNISGANNPSSFSTSAFAGIDEVNVEIQSESENETGNSQARSATDLARSQRLRNL